MLHHVAENPRMLLGGVFVHLGKLVGRDLLGIHLGELLRLWLVHALEPLDKSLRHLRPLVGVELAIC